MLLIYNKLFGLFLLVKIRVFSCVTIHKKLNYFLQPCRLYLYPKKYYLKNSVVAIVSYFFRINIINLILAESEFEELCFSYGLELDEIVSYTL